MPRTRPRALASTLILILALLLLAACDSTDDGDTPSIGHLLSTTLTPTTTTEAIAATSTGTGTPAGATATGTQPPTTPEKPRVLWMLRDHGGANLAVVRFAANVEVTAVLNLASTPGQPTGIDPQTDAAFATQHTMSIPLSLAPAAPVPAFHTHEVTDHQGAKATATLEYGDAIVGTQYWGRTEGTRPAFAWSAPFKGNATWSNILGAPPAPGPGTVQLFAKRAGCTTAEQCAPTLLTTFTQDTRTPFEGGERHGIPVDLPPTPDQDFQLLYTTTIDAAQTTTFFYQRDIPRTAAVAGHD
jgi:hypothetical protein